MVPNRCPKDTGWQNPFSYSNIFSNCSKFSAFLPYPALLYYPSELEVAIIIMQNVPTLRGGPSQISSWCS